MTECKTCDDVARQIKCDEKCQKELKDIWNAPQYMFNNTTYDHNTIWATGYRNILAIQSRDRRRIGARTEKLQESMYHSEERNFSDMSHGWQSSCASDLIKRIDLIVSINKYKTRLKWFVSDETIIDQCEFSCYRRNKSANDKFDYKQIGKYRIDSPDFDFWLRNSVDK